MFLSQMSIALELIALGIGAGLIIWALQHKGHGHSLAKITGLIIMIVAFTDFGYTLYFATHSFKYRHYSLYTKQPMMMQNHMQSGSNTMMTTGMCQCPMAQQQMNKMGHH